MEENKSKRISEEACRNKYFELKNSWGCRPNSNYLLTQSQVRYMTICSNLPIQKALACTELHSCKGTQIRTDCANFFFLSFAHSELHQTILLFIPRGFHCVLRFSTRNTCTASKPKNRGFTPSPSLALFLLIVLGSVVKIESWEATNLTRSK